MAQRQTKKIEENRQGIQKAKGIWIVMSFLFIGAVIALGFWLFAQWREMRHRSEIQRIEEIRNIKVQVLNGCGKPGVALKFTDFLRKEGFDVINGNGENAENYGFAETIVVDRSGILRKAEMVAKVLDTENCIRQVKLDKYRIEHVTVIIGRDFKRLKPYTTSEDWYTIPNR